MSLYIEHRPTSLKEIKGNKDIITTLENLLSDKDKMPHVFLLHGPTGCGKTTIARIIKDMLEVSDKDYIENNSANDRGIDAMRKITRDSRFAPTKSPFRIYLLDEAHKITPDGQNVLLKDLEDTPKHVVYILCTTEPTKVIAPLRNRCQQFQVKLLSDKEMKQLLKDVSKKEGEKLSKEVLEQIILEAGGHPRNALQILEQVLATPEKDRLEAAKQSAKEYSQSIELCKALLKRTGWKEIAGILRGLKQQDAESIRRHVMGYASAVLINGKTNDRAAVILEEFLEPTYNSGFNQIVFACYSVINN